MKKHNQELKQMRSVLRGYYSEIARECSTTTATVSRILNNFPHSYEMKLSVLTSAKKIYNRVIQEKEAQNQQLEKIIA